MASCNTFGPFLENLPTDEYVPIITKATTLLRDTEDKVRLASVRLLLDIVTSCALWRIPATAEELIEECMRVIVEEAGKLSSNAKGNSLSTEHFLCGLLNIVSASASCRPLGGALFRVSEILGIVNLDLCRLHVWLS